MMDFLETIEIEPRYPGRRQSKLLSKLIRSSQYEPQTHEKIQRHSIYKQLSEPTRSQTRKSKHLTTDTFEAPRERANSCQADSSHNRRSRHPSKLSPDLVPPSSQHYRTSDSQKPKSRLSKYNAAVSPDLQKGTVTAGIPIATKISTSPKMVSGSPNSIDLLDIPSRTRSTSVKSQVTKNGTDDTTLADHSDEIFETSNLLDDKMEPEFQRAPTPTKPLTEVGDYTIKRDIGQGTFGVVKLGEHKITKQLVAIKVITKSSIKSSRARARVEQELRLLPLLDHPHIVKVYDVVEDEDHYMIVMEHLTGGELFQYIVKNRRINEREARYFFRQIVSALDYCHQNSIIHRDMKPENLLLDSKMQIRLIDFGFANFYCNDSTLSTFCGSPYYASPEMIRGVDYVGPEVDIWSLGVTLYTMLSGKLPFNSYNLKSFQRKVARGDYEIPVYFSKDVSELTKCMLNTDRRKRMSMEKIRLHSWTNAGYGDLPNSHLSIRPPTVRKPDPELIKKMAEYGYKIDDHQTMLLASTGATQPMFSLYHLLDERRARKVKEDQKIEEIKQRSLRGKAAKEAGITAVKLTDGEEAPLPSLPDESEDCDIVNTIKSRRYSIDTPREEDDFVGAIPLSQTPLKAAGRSFDSISRRTSVRSKIRPVVMPPPDAEALVPTPGLKDDILGREAKEGWFTGLFNVSVTSTKPYQQIVQELERVLVNLQIEYQKMDDRFVGHNPANKLAFEVRIVYKEHLRAYHVMFKNLKGSSWAHKKYCYKIIQRMYI